MDRYTEGNYLGPDSAVKLVESLLAEIRYSKGFKISTGSAVTCKQIQLPSGVSDNWTAYGTLLDVPEKIFLQPTAKFRFVLKHVDDMNESQVGIIPAVYRYSDVDESTGLPKCDLLFRGESVSLTTSGWCESAVILPETPIELNVSDFYFLVYLYNLASPGTIGYPGTHSDSVPYISFISAGLGELHDAPETLIMQQDVAMHVFGSIYNP